jgi:glycosyltransferase involved in cell wall biosynthesis
MRILIASTAHYPALNGQAVFTEHLAEGLAQRGHVITAVFPSEKGKPYQKVRNDVQIEAVRSANLNQFHKDAHFSLFAQRAIRRILDSFQPEIIHIQDHFPLSRSVLQVARDYPAKLIGTNHFMPENLAAYIPLISNVKPVYNRIMWSLMMNVYNRLDVATAQSKASAELMISQGLRIPVRPVSCGIDLGFFHPDPGLDRRQIRERYGIDPQKTVFLFVGRVDYEKRIDVLLRAMHLLQRDDTQLVIAGHGSEKEKLEAQASELELGGRVRFTGYIPREDLPALLNSVDIFVMASQAELLSIATLEAMACGKPVLLADAVALPELVTVGQNGYLFTLNDPADAAHYMALLADQPEKWPQMGAAGLEKTRYHSMESAIQQYEAIYEALIQAETLPHRWPRGRDLQSKFITPEHL